MPSSFELVPLGQVVVARLQQRRKRAQLAALLDHRHVAGRPDGVDDVVVAEDLALPAVERLDALVLVRPFVEVRDPGVGDAAAAADHEGPLEVAPAGGVVDAQQPGAHFARRRRRRRATTTAWPHTAETCASAAQARAMKRRRAGTRPVASARFGVDRRAAQEGRRHAERRGAGELLVGDEVALEAGVADQAAVGEDGDRRCGRL